jgi:hypothetical protein
VTRQHSYGEDVKPTVVSPGTEETGLGLPAPMPRRASAYDVFSVPGLSTVTGSSQGGRRASFRVPPPESASPPSPETGPTILVPPEDDRRARRRGSQL